MLWQATKVCDWLLSSCALMFQAYKLCSSEKEAERLLENIEVRQFSFLYMGLVLCYTSTSLVCLLITDVSHPTTSHTRMVVRECFKGEANQWKRPKFDPSPHQYPLTDLHKNWQAWLSPRRHPACKILYRSVQGFLFPKYVILPCFWGD